MERYLRHIQLEGFGTEAQQKLLDARVLVVGAGGLGVPVLMYLAAAGVGNIGLVDPDVVSLHNLHRQVLYNTYDVGKSKVTVAKERLSALNPDIDIVGFVQGFESKMVEAYDIIVDCTDNIDTRYAINDACYRYKKPWIYGALFQYEGQVAVFNLLDQKGIKTDYRDLFPEIKGEIPTCNVLGVLGVLPGVIGMLQANEAIKCITGVGEPLINKLLMLDLRDYRQFIVEISPSQKRTKSVEVLEINKKKLKEFQLDGDVLIMDVREEGEFPETEFISYPLSEWKAKGVPNVKESRIVTLCQSGVRSLAAGKMLKERYGDVKEIYHLKGGLLYEGDIL